MTAKITFLPLRRHRRRYRRSPGDVVFGLLAGLRPGHGIGGAVGFPPAAPAAEAPRAARPAGTAPDDTWARFQSGLAAGG